MNEKYDLIEKIYNKNGIVTRKDYSGLDSRAFGRTLQKEMEKRGYFDAIYREFALDGYVDYSGVLFNPDAYTEEEVEHYMKNHVLTDTY